MAKLSLASAPKTFKRTINIELLDGSTADVELTFKYKTRSEYAKLLDEVMKSEDGDAKKETAVDVFARLGEGTADFLMKIVDGWDLEDKFTKANVVKLIDSFPAVSNEITEVYRVAILEGRVKN
jgi:hypothetical protein